MQPRTANGAREQWLGPAFLAASVLSFSRSADAQVDDEIWRVLAPSNTPELGVNTAYAQGFGGLGPGRSIWDVAGPGFSVALACDYRATRAASFGIEGAYQVFSQENTTSSMAMDVNLGATIHFQPRQKMDPWVRVGTGYRFFWSAHPPAAPGTTDMFHGFDVAILRIGFDLRTSDNVAVGPFLGGDLQSFVWQNATALPTVSWSSFLQAGLAGRFDTGQPSLARIAKYP